MKKKSIKKNIFTKPIIKKASKEVSKPAPVKFLVSKSLVSKSDASKSKIIKPEVSKAKITKPEVIKPIIKEEIISNPVVAKTEPVVVVPEIKEEPPILIKTLSVGNDSSMRTAMDGYTDFTIIDTNNPISANGELKVFSYYAFNLNPFRFVLVDADNEVKWVSNIITPVYIGINNYTPSAPVSVQAKWNLGVYSTLAAVIPFEGVGLPTFYTPNRSGTPVVGTKLIYKGSAPRKYSFKAIGIEK